MKKFTIKSNYYLSKSIESFFNCEYLGYQKDGNPDFINKLKNASRRYDELDLVEDYMTVYEIVKNDIESIISQYNDLFTVCVIPRSKAEKNYHPSQLLFKKAISNVSSNLPVVNGTDAIIRVVDTKTTHSWNNEHNNGDSPYKGITKDTCKIDKKTIAGKNIILVDDVYTEDKNIAEDCIQTLLDFGAKSVILYVIAKTR